MGPQRSLADAGLCSREIAPAQPASSSTSLALGPVYSSDPTGAGVLPPESHGLLPGLHKQVPRTASCAQARTTACGQGRKASGRDLQPQCSATGTDDVSAGDQCLQGGCRATRGSATIKYGSNTQLCLCLHAQRAEL